VNPATSASETCAGGSCECGKEGQACCALGDACTDAGTSCLVDPKTAKKACLRCGVPGNPCCANNACADDGCCVYELTAGVILSVCAAPGDGCQGGAGTCGGGSCGECGGLGQLCCYHEGLVNYYCSAPNTYCPTQSSSTVKCQPCGGKNQPCCGPTSILPGGLGTCSDGLTCRQNATGASYACQ
jgi:hypothetical protein